MTRTTRRTAPPFSVVEFKAITDGNVAPMMKWLDDGGQMDEWVEVQMWNATGRSNALLCASTLGQLAVVDLLLERGASVNLQADTGFTPLMSAARFGHAAIVRSLLRAGAQIGMRNCKGYTAQKLAEEQGHHECVRVIREHIEAMVAAQLKKSAEASPPAVEVEAAEAPSAAEACADKGSARGQFPPGHLKVAIDLGDLAGVAAWLDGGGQVDCGWADEVSDVYNITTLMGACSLGHLPVVDLLLERGATVDLQSSLRQTALMEAAYQGYDAIVRRLLRAGAQISLRGCFGYTALGMAEMHGQHECVRILREHGKAMAAEKREYEAAMAAEKRARRKDKKRAAKAAAQAASADKAAAVAAAAEAARLEHEETMRRHDEREAAERTKAKAAEEAKRAQVTAQRQAKAQAPPKPLTPASQQPAPKAKTERSAQRNDAAELEHQVHINPDQKSYRVVAFEARQMVAKEDAAVKNARAHAKALKEASARASADAEAARHVVPSAPTMSDMVAGVLG